MRLTQNLIHVTGSPVLSATETSISVKLLWKVKQARLECSQVQTRIQQETFIHFFSRRRYQTHPHRNQHLIDQLCGSDGQFSVTAHSLRHIHPRQSHSAHADAHQGKLPFTYRTFGVSGAQAQSHYSQHAGYSQHLLGRGSAPGKRRNHGELSPRGSPR